MSDNEDYYSDSDVSDVDEEEKQSKNIVKKNILNKAITIDDFNDDDEDDEQEDIADDDDDDDEEQDVAEDEEEDEEEDEDDDDEYDDIMQVGGADDDKKKTKKSKPQPTKIVEDDGEYEDDDDDEDEENYLQKFNQEISKNYIHEFHPECLNENFEEIVKLSKVIRDSNGLIIDPFHKTIPFLTKYEKTRILGQRAKQIENGAKPFVNVPETIIDSYIIAELELQQKKIPFIIRRPLPNGAFEYWNVKDLDNIAF